MKTLGMPNMKVVTNRVLIENEEFVLISFDARLDEEKEWYGDRIYALVNYEHLDANGCLNKPLTGGEMAISGSPAEAIERKRNDLKARQWRAEHPNATDQEFMQYLLTLYAVS